MSCRLGIEVRAADVRAVLMKSGSMRWHATAPLNHSMSLVEALDHLLSSVPRVSARRPPVVVAVCFAKAQVKRLDGLPGLTARGEMTQLLRENAGSIFLRAASAVAIPDAYRFGDGAAWGAAIDRSVIDDVVATANRRGFRVLSLLPSVCALARMFPSTSTEVFDGETTLELTTKGGELRALRRTCAPGPTPTVPDALREIGDSAPAYLGAYAAALSSRNAPLAWRPEAAPEFAAVVRRVRSYVAAVSLLIAVTAAIAAPGIHEILFTRQTATVIATSHRQQVEMATAESDLLSATKLLESVDQFKSTRGQLTQLLAQLTQSLPESTAIVALRVDSTAGSFVAISPHIADLIGELGTVDQISSPRIIGSVTRETVAGVRVERAAFRFRRPRVGAGRGRR